MRPIALTIAGSDPGGGAGAQADLKTFHQFGVYGTSAITLITVQNTAGMSRVEYLAADLIHQQIEAVVSDLPPRAAKTGALGSAGAIMAVTSANLCCPLVVDPVMMGKHGVRLLDEDAMEALRRHLLPKAALVTPNIPEACELSGLSIETPEDMMRAAARIAEYGPEAVLVKGGHLSGNPTDVLWEGGEVTLFEGNRLASRHTHGTGCTLSAAITAGLALGLRKNEAIARAKAFVTAAIETAPGLGAGAGPLNHWAIIGISTPMTKVQKHFHLQCELDDTLLERIAGANSIYGIERIIIAPSGQDLIVEYDASRLREANIEAALGAAGIPVAQVANG